MEVVAESHRLLPKLRDELLSGRYQPGDVRRVWIPKPGGGQRGLGIPTVVDRWVQQAVHEVLAPVFEPAFHDSSHGFRPHRGAQTALSEATGHLMQGYTWVVGLDLSKFFDRVNHQRLLARLGQRVGDKRLLRLVHRMLKAKVVLPDGTRVATEEGTPQGGPLSPLLSNVVLDELDWELERRGLRFVRYADDFNVYVRSERAARRVMATLNRFIEGRLRLQVNREKSVVASSAEVHFLGFHLHPRADGGGVEVHLSKRSEERLNRRIRELTPQNWGGSLERCLEALNRYLLGWSGYFRLCTEEGAKRFRRFDAHVRRRLRAIIIRQKKRPRYLYRHLVARGVPRDTAARTSWASCGVWRKSNFPGLTIGYRNHWFEERLVSLWLRWRHNTLLLLPASDQLALAGLDTRPEEPDVRSTSPVL
jgi:group II intron reverse transcriptase/maturase